mmetsp:Transcript_23202/g.49406  ORF Transcript_23202/g.49406 Transcript_23202/m.49406 type:complete len:165 (+) Transcript_23202:556-1050(+)
MFLLRSRLAGTASMVAMLLWIATVSISIPGRAGASPVVLEQNGSADNHDIKETTAPESESFGEGTDKEEDNQAAALSLRQTSVPRCRPKCIKILAADTLQKCIDLCKSEHGHCCGNRLALKDPDYTTKKRLLSCGECRILCSGHNQHIFRCCARRCFVSVYYFW